MSIEADLCDDRELYSSFSGNPDRKSSFSSSMGWYPGILFDKRRMKKANEELRKAEEDALIRSQRIDEFSPGINEAALSLSHTNVVKISLSDNKKTNSNNNDNQDIKQSEQQQESSRYWYPGMLLGMERKPGDRRTSSADSSNEDISHQVGRVVVGGGANTISALSGSGGGDGGRGCNDIAEFLNFHPVNPPIVVSASSAVSFHADYDYPGATAAVVTGSNKKTIDNVDSTTNGSGSSKTERKTVRGLFAARKQSADEMDAESIKKEAAVAYAVRWIRNKFIQRGLIGKILVTRMSGSIATSACINIGPKDTIASTAAVSSSSSAAVMIASPRYTAATSHLNIDNIGSTTANNTATNPPKTDNKPLPQIDRTALASLDALFVSLENRSKAWESEVHWINEGEDGDEILLSSSTSFGVSADTSLLGNSVVVLKLDVSATVNSLQKAFRIRIDLVESLRAQEQKQARGNFNFFKRSTSLPGQGQTQEPLQSQQDASLYQQKSERTDEYENEDTGGSGYSPYRGDSFSSEMDQASDCWFVFDGNNNNTFANASCNGDSSSSSGHAKQQVIDHVDAAVAAELRGTFSTSPSGAIEV